MGLMTGDDDFGALEDEMVSLVRDLRQARQARANRAHHQQTPGYFTTSKCSPASGMPTRDQTHPSRNPACAIAASRWLAQTGVVPSVCTSTEAQPQQTWERVGGWGNGLVRIGLGGAPTSSQGGATRMRTLTAAPLRSGESVGPLVQDRGRFDGAWRGTLPTHAAVKRRRIESKRDTREKENFEAIGGMRNPSRAVRRLPKLRLAGARLRRVLEDFIGTAVVLLSCFSVSAVGAGRSRVFFSRTLWILSRLARTFFGGEVSARADSEDFSRPPRQSHWNAWGRARGLRSTAACARSGAL